MLTWRQCVCNDMLHATCYILAACCIVCNDMLHAIGYILAAHAHSTPTAEDGRRWQRERVEGWRAPKVDHSCAARVEH